MFNSPGAAVHINSVRVSIYPAHILTLTDDMLPLWWLAPTAQKISPKPSSTASNWGVEIDTWNQTRNQYKARQLGKNPFHLSISLIHFISLFHFIYQFLKKWYEHFTTFLTPRNHLLCMWFLFSKQKGKNSPIPPQSPAESFEDIYTFPKVWMCLKNIKIIQKQKKLGRNIKNQKLQLQNITLFLNTYLQKK